MWEGRPGSTGGALISAWGRDQKTRNLMFLEDWEAKNEVLAGRMRGLWIGKA